MNIYWPFLFLEYYFYFSFILMDTKKTIFIFGKARLPDCKFGKKYIQLNKFIK